MNAATPFPWPESSPEAYSEPAFRSIFEQAPMAIARCNRQGVIDEMNPAFARDAGGSGTRPCRHLSELVRTQDRDKTHSMLLDLLDSRIDAIAFEGRAGDGRAATKWIGWRQLGSDSLPDHALLIADPPGQSVPAEESLVQAQRWEALGRLAGGVVHDFNNLLTGVMLCSDLLLSSLDLGDRRRRHADEIRSATVQAASLVRQLLVFARPPATPVTLLSLNEVVWAMQGLLTRLIGEPMQLDLLLEKNLDLVKIEPAQAQQILLNLVLNARDAMQPDGRITIETRNCRFQPVAGPASQTGAASFACVQLVVGDNGHGMSAEVRERLGEPFFTTKNSGRGTGLGLTTVHSIVTANRGLIHFESEPGKGTRAMILLPRALQSGGVSVSAPSTDSRKPDSRTHDSRTPDSRTPDSATAHSSTPATPFQEIKKESLL